MTSYCSPAYYTPINSSPRPCHDSNAPQIENELDLLKQRLARQKALTDKKVREASIRAENQERDRIAHELHDNICQILGSMHLYLDCLDRENPDFDFIKQRLSEISSLAIEEIRCLSHNIVSPNLLNNGLIASIQHLVDDIRYTRRFEIGFLYTDLQAIESQGSDLKLTVYRVIQEQIRNICKYSQATHVHISLSGANDHIRLHIGDDGLGFDPQKAGDGLGLSNIVNRARSHHGKARINTAPGKGCELIVTIPLEIRRIA